MQTKKPLLIAISVFISISISQAQVDFRKFPMDSFKLPAIDRSALVFSGSLNGDYSNLNIPALKSYTTSSFSPRFGLGYSRFINTIELQRTSSINVSQDLSIQHSETFGSVDRTRYDASFGVSETRRRYKGNSFIQSGGSIEADYDFDRSSINDQKDNYLSGSAEVTGGFGRGRIEPISDVAMAMFILKDATDLGLDGSMITTEDIYAFASLMAEVRNRRIFDSRRMRIAELRDLYAFMLAENLVIPNDPGFFSVLTDNWIYNDIGFRNSGKRWSYLLTPGVDYSHFRQRSSNQPELEFEGTELGATVIVDFTKYKPISLYKDNVRQHTLSVGTTSRFPEIIPTTFLTLGLNNNFGRNWYPNNRTSIELGLNANYEYYRYVNPPENLVNPDQHYFRTGLSAQTTYFVSYKTRFVANALLSYSYDTGGFIVPHFINNISTAAKSSGFEARISGSLVISLF